MLNHKRTFVDAHMHVWDAPKNPWYAFPVPGNDWGMGLKDHFPARFLLEEYRQAVAPMDVKKCVHVTAVTEAKDAAAESIWIEELANHDPLICATIGTLQPETGFDHIEKTLDREMTSPRFRGIRLLNGLDYDAQLSVQLMRSLTKRKLVYDVVTHFDKGIAAAAKGLTAFEDLVVVLEHCGWPNVYDAAHFKQWRHELAEFAALPNTYCKLSGIGMWLHRTSPEIFSAYLDACIELFGPQRCMFASNFPVDLSYGSSGGLFAIFEKVAANYAEHEQKYLFETTAEKIYRI